MQLNPAPKDVAERRCRDCGSPMWRLGTEQFRVGGTSGVWKLFFGEWAELGEEMLPLELAVCPVCRRVEMWVPAGFQPAEEQVRGLRYACPGRGGDVYQGDLKCPSCGQALRQFAGSQR